MVDLSFTDREMKLLMVAVQFAEKVAIMIPGVKSQEFTDLRKKVVCDELEAAQEAADQEV